MSNSRFLLGVALVILGIGVGLWVGLWWSFIGGIAIIIHQIQAPHADATQVGIGVLRILFASPIGFACGFLIGIPGVLLLKD